MVLGAPACAAQAEPPPAAVAGAAQPDAQPAPAAAPTVTSAQVSGRAAPGGQVPTVELGDAIDVSIDGLRQWTVPSQGSPNPVPGTGKPPTQAQTGDPFQLILYLNGYPLRGVTVEAVRGDTITVRLRRTSDNRESWAALFARPKGDPVSITVGLPGKSPFPTSVPGPTINLRLYRPWVIVSSFVGFAALFGLFLVLARKHALLCDGDNTRPASQRSYSLARCQMALWTFTILGSFVFLRVATKDWDVLPTQTLILMGISLATGMGAAAIDASKQSSARNRLIELQGKDALTSEETGEVANLHSHLAGPTRDNWLIDILSDADGISFHRFQLFCWTLVLWVMFMASVYRNLAMPEFSDQLLTLLGISGGAYLGFKFPERKV